MADLGTKDTKRCSLMFTPKVLLIVVEADTRAERSCMTHDLQRDAGDPYVFGF